MHYPRFARFLVSLAFVVPFFVSARAHAQVDAKVETASKTLQKKAMQDYVAIDFQKAREKLDKAIADCGADKCSAGLRASLHRDLGVVLIGGKLDRDKGVAAFAEAYKADPKVELDPDLKTKDLETAWETAKKGGTSAPAAPNPNSKNPAGDFKHTPVPEQRYRTAVPVYAEYAGEETIVRVIVRYKGFGMTEYKPVELKKMGEKGWGGLVPCGDVQVGTTQYYIQGFNAENDPVAVAGDRNNTFKVQIRREPLAGEAPHLPGEQPPSQCQDTGDCPPDFPGCKRVSGANATVVDDTLKGEGSDCEADNECRSGTCEKGKGEQKTCAAQGEGKVPRIWVGLFGSFDVASFVPSAENVCKLHPRDAADTDTSLWNTPINDKGYYCTEGDRDYPTRFTNATERAENDAIIIDKSSKVKSGSVFGSNIRFYASFDYALNMNLLAGARAGVTIPGYPGTEAGTDAKRWSVPALYLEARGTYVFGKDALAKAGLAGYAFGGLGLSTFESKVEVAVAEQGKAQTRTVDAWSISGPFFITVGGGARYAITPRAALMGGLRANFAFGNTFIPAIAPEIGGQIGF